MDDRRFDSLVKVIGSASSRRSLIKGTLGALGIVATASVVRDQTDAARRGYSGPPFPPTASAPTATVPTQSVPPTTTTCLGEGASCNVNDPSACCSRQCLTNGGNPICAAACLPGGSTCNVTDPTVCCSRQCVSNGGSSTCADACRSSGSPCDVLNPSVCCSGQCNSTGGNSTCV